MSLLERLHTKYYDMYGVNMRLPYDLLAGSKKRVYDTDSCTEQQMHVFIDSHVNVRERLQTSRAEILAKQHRNAVKITIKIGDTVMVRLPERNSKLSPNLLDPASLFASSKATNMRSKTFSSTPLT